MFLPSMSAMERTCARLSISAEVRKKWANRNDKKQQEDCRGKLVSIFLNSQNLHYRRVSHACRVCLTLRAQNQVVDVSDYVNGRK